MSQEDYSAKLLDMEEARIERIEEGKREIRIQVELKRRKQECPRCGQETDQIHDYRTRRVVDLSIRGKRVELNYRRRRYICPECGKQFAESCGFVGRYQRFTHRMAEEIMEMLRRRHSMKDIAAMTGTSVSGVVRCLNLAAAPRPEELPEVLSFDEFKGDTNGERFHTIITDPKNRRIFDILPTRNVTDLQDYLKKFDNRDKVKCVVIDMNRGYRDVVKTFLPGAKIVIDRFHVVRYCTWAMDDVRRRVQKALPAEKRRYFKRSRRLLLARRSRLSDEDRAAVDVILYHSEDLIRAYALKELFYQFMDSKSRGEAARVLEEWLDAADRLKLPEFLACRNMLRNWKPYILNAFDLPYSNGFTEGCNNATKVLKRVAFGFRSFTNFRKRILLAAAPYPYI